MKKYSNKNGITSPVCFKKKPVLTLSFLFLGSVFSPIDFVFSQSPSVVAQKPGLVPMVAALEAGQYNFEQYDKSLIQQLRNNEHFLRNKNDLEFLLQTRQDLQTDFNLLMTDYVNNVDSGLARMNAIYLSGGSVPVVEFYRAAVGYKNVVQLLKAKILSLEGLVKALPSVSQGVDGSLPVPNYLNVELSQLSKIYLQLLEAAEEMVQGDKAMQFRIVFQDGVPRVFSAREALNFKFDTVPTLSAEQRDQMRQKAMELRSLSESDKQVAGLFGDYLRLQITHYRDNFGVREKYRWRNQEDVKAAEEAFARIEQAFWARSYLRTMYGLPLGVLTLRDYPKQWGKVDRFLVSNQVLSTFVQGLTWEDRFLMDQKESLRNAALTIDQRVGNIFEGEADPLKRLNSIITLVKGERPVAEVMNKVFALFIGDITEELMVTSGDGEESLIHFYKSRYYSDVLSEKYYQQLEDIYFSNQDGRISSFQKGTLGYQVEKLKVLAEKRMDKVGEASDLMALVRLEERRGGSGQVRDQVDGRRNRLRGNN